MKKIFSFLAIIIATHTSIKASHLLGGEITWECSGQDYIFTLKLYKDCGTGSGGTGGLGVSQTINITGGGHNRNSITTLIVDTNDLTPICNSYQTNKLTCPGSPSSSGTMLEYIYKSDTVNLSGVIPSTGWTYSWSTCCRPAGFINGSNSSFYLRSIIYPYSVSSNARPCYDNSPKFAIKPNQVYCLGYGFSYNNNAIDKEQDSLSIKWAAPLTANNTSIIYTSPYSSTNPHPGNPQLNSNNGSVYVTDTNIIVAFPTCIAAEAWKCNEKVAEVFRDYPIVFSGGCGKLNDGISNNTSPDILINNVPLTGNTNYIDTILVGDTVCFTIKVVDNEKSPPSGNSQINTLTPYGQQFGVPITSDTGCLAPPCATLKHPVTGGMPILTDSIGIEAKFCWITKCGHLATNWGCPSDYKSHNFILDIRDDFCPVPGISMLTVTIVVKNIPGYCSPVSITNSEKQNDFNIYPNPTTSLLNIEHTKGSNPYNLMIYNSLGQSVYQKDNITTNLQVDSKSFKPGVLFIKISSENETSHFKIIKQ